MKREESGGGVTFVEPRWPIALALSTFIVITVVLRLAGPHRDRHRPRDR
jgi:hypothetical protein